MGRCRVDLEITVVERGRERGCLPWLGNEAECAGACTEELDAGFHVLRDLREFAVEDVAAVKRLEGERVSWSSSASLQSSRAIAIARLQRRD